MDLNLEKLSENVYTRKTFKKKYQKHIKSLIKIIIKHTYLENV